MTQTNTSTPPVTVESLRSGRWRQSSGCNTCFELSERLRSLAREAASENNSVEAAGLDLLAGLCEMGLDADSGKGPFHPFVVMNGRRSLLPDDLSPEEVSAVAALADEEDVPAILRARLADVAWLRTNPRAPQFARVAIDAYVANSPTPDAWFHGQCEEWARAIGLCRELRRDGVEKHLAIEKTLVANVLSESTTQPRFIHSVAQLIASCGMGKSSRAEIAAVLEAAAQEPEEQFDWDASRNLLLESAKWFNRAGDEAAAARATSKAAETWAAEATFYESRPGIGPLMAGMCHESAIQLLRTIPRQYRESFNVDERVSNHKKAVRECNERAADATVPFVGELIDLTNLAEASRAAVSGKDAWQALSAFVRVVTPTPPAHWRDHAGEAMKQYPLQSLFSNVHYSKDGRLVARSPGLDFGDTGSAAWQRAVENRAIQNHSIFQGIAVQGAILPALDAISLDHRFPEAVFVELAARSPAVPHGRERIFGRGLCAGYRRDFAIAVHLLTPQVEHLVRVHIVAAGGETRKLDPSSGVQTEIGLSALIELPEVTKVFGETLAFELQAVFCDSAGPNLRNSLAHGLLDDDDMFSAASVYAWWLTLRLIMLPLMNMQAAKATAPAQPGDGTS